MISVYLLLDLLQTLRSGVQHTFQLSFRVRISCLTSWRNLAKGTERYKKEHYGTNLCYTMCYTLTWKCVTLLLLLQTILPKLMMPPKTLNEMKKKLVDVVFDRRKIAATKGYGFLEVRVYLGRTGRKYIKVDKCKPDEWEKLAASAEAVEIIKKCEGIITAMEVLEEEMNVENFNFHYSGEMKKPKEVVEAEKKAEESQSKKSFIRYIEMALEDEELRHGTWKNKRVVIDAVKRYGKLNTYGDLTPAKIMDFDNWLHDGTRTDVTCSGYH